MIFNIRQQAGHGSIRGAGPVFLGEQKKPACRLETSLAVDRLLACIRGEAPQQTLISIPVHLELRESSL